MNKNGVHPLNLPNTQKVHLQMKLNEDLSYKNSKESYFTLNNKNNLTDLKGNQNYACNYQNNGEVENLLPNHGIVNMPYTPTLPQEDQNLNYYQEYCRLFIANVVLTTQMKELVTEKNLLFNKLEKLEKKTEEFNNVSQTNTEEERRKRFRRTAGEIDRHYRCPVEICLKSYGSEGSLNQHIKLKHPELYSAMVKNQTILSQPHLSDQEKSFSLKSESSSKFEIKKK